jgi:hypothetical protein
MNQSEQMQRSLGADAQDEAAVTKKTFIAVAATLKKIKTKIGDEAHKELLDDLMDIFAGLNPQFDRGRFSKASGVE